MCLSSFQKIEFIGRNPRPAVAMKLQEMERGTLKIERKVEMEFTREMQSARSASARADAQSIGQFS